MIDVLLTLLTALGFGIGVTFSVLGFVLIFQIFVKGKAFNSWFVMTQVAVALSTLGLTFLWIVLT